MNQLGGHPLAMRAILPRLEIMTASQVVAALRRNLADLGAQSDEALARVYATLAFVRQSLPAELQGLLVPLGLHENYVTTVLLELMAKQADPTCTLAQINSLIEALEVAGLLRDVAQGTYEMHPLLTSYLRSSVMLQADAEIRERWTRAFVDVMGSRAHSLAPRELHEQRGPFHVHGQNFYYALEQAERLGMNADIGALTKSMGEFAQNSRNFADAARLYELWARNRAQAGDRKGEASAYHQLGNVAYLRRDFSAAESWYGKSLEIGESEGNEKVMAASYHQLGALAQERQDFADAREWSRKSLAIEEKLGNEKGMAVSYHQLGSVAQRAEEFTEAEQWYLKSLDIKNKLGDESGAALTLGQLGRVAADRKDFAVAVNRYIEAASTFERLNQEMNESAVYSQLGRVAGEVGDLESADKWSRQALVIQERIKELRILQLRFRITNLRGSLWLLSQQILSLPLREAQGQGRMTV